MTTDLPLVHPAQDPSAEATARARRRVQHTIRRRRARRRAIGSGAFTAVAVAVAGAAGARGAFPFTDDHGDEIVARGGNDDPDPADVQADTPWSDPILSPDERTLTIEVGAAPPGDGPCDENYRHEVVETDTSVTVGFEKLPSPPGSDGAVCVAMAQPQHIAVELDAPLGDRPAYDGVRPGPQTVHRLDTLAEVTYVPDGWTAGEPLTAGTAEDAWDQPFSRDGAGWSFSVVQEPTSAATTPEGTPLPVTVHGTEGVRYSGQVDGAMESIRWVEGDVTLTVRGLMDRPAPFAHGAELLRIAEGVRLP